MNGKKFEGVSGIGIDKNKIFKVFVVIILAEFRLLMES